MKAKAIVKICICGTIALVLASVLVSLLAIPRVLDWKIGDLSLHWIDDHGGDEGYTVGEASVSGEVRELGAINDFRFYRIAVIFRSFLMKSRVPLRVIIARRAFLSLIFF